MKLNYIVAVVLILFSLGILGCIEPDTIEPDKLTGAEYEKRRIKIIDYFSERQKRYDVIATTKTQTGQIIDWVRPESQVSSGVVATPPSQKITTTRNPKSELKNPSLDKDLPKDLQELSRKDASAKTEVQLDKSALGPKGTVPIVRFNVESYLKENPTYLPKDPLEILTKTPPPSPASNDRYYVAWQRSGDVFGSIGRINIWNTTGPVGGETSIAQVAVIRGTPMQAIEAGKIEHSSFAPSKRPTFFTYFRTNGAASGDWVAGYNALVDGWIQVSSSVAPGMSLVPWESATSGSQYSLDVEVRLWKGNWWVRAAGEWAGYYPYCKGGSSQPCAQGTLFSSAGIRDKANRLDWYGEIFDESAPAATSTDMGSGAFANQRWQRATYFRNILFTWSPTQAWWWNSGSITTTDPACYSADGPYYSSDPNWRNWFYYGGPGKEAANCN